MSDESKTPAGETKEDHGQLQEETSESRSGGFKQPTPVIKTEPKRFFQCADCGLYEEYDYFGKNPPFCRSILFLDDSYVGRDPFSPHSGNNANFLLLGSNCAVCSRMTCQECSTFFTKRFCAQCYKLCSMQLPEELRAKKKAKD